MAISIADQFRTVAPGGTVYAGRGGPPSVQPAGYRDGQTYLFQPVPAPTASTLGGGAYNFENEQSSLWGPSRTHVSRSNYSGWAWTNAGGDWIDSALVSMGTTHWATQAVSAVSGVPTTHAIDVTAAVQHVQTVDRWNAWIVSRASGTNYRYLAGRTNSTAAYRPRIEVTYSDATTATLACRVSSRLNSGTPDQLSAEMVLSTSAGTGEMALEFERPTKAVSSATLYVTVTQDGGGSGTLRFNIADPPRNTEPVTDGLAASAGVLDEGITELPNVIGAQRYVDGTSSADFIAALGASQYNQESHYDPAIYGTGAEDLTKLPHRDFGKWIDSNQDVANLALVDSTYNLEGFEPLAPGLGALRCEMPDTGVETGDEQSNGGTTAVARKLFMPGAEYGLLDRIFVRYYIRLGTPYAPAIGDIKEILRFGSPEWTAMGGKWGITPEHVTSYGGFSGSSGGQRGWQLRHKWVDGQADLSSSPPDGGAIHSGWHLYDFNTNNPVGYRYASEPVWQEGWGQKGGYGATFYPGRWYCIEQEVKLNSVDTPSGTGDGLDWTPDGELRVWVDGRLAYERTGMVFRALPLYDPGYNATQLRPIREIGVKALLWNFYHGGLNNSTYKRVQFVTGLVWAKARIGQMKTSAAPELQLSGTDWTPNVDGSGNVLDSDFDQLPLFTTLKIVTNKLDDVVPTPRYGIKNGATDGSVSIVRGWSGAAIDHINQRMYISGGGHADSHICENGIYRFDSRTLRFSVQLPRSDDDDGQWYDSGAGNFVALTGPTDTHNDSIGSPMADGHFPASHTFWGIDYLSPTTMGNTNGGYLSFFGTKQIVNLDDNSLSVPHWTSPGDNVDFSYAFVISDGLRAVMPYGDFYCRAWDFDSTTTTTWTTETGSGDSVGAILYPAASSTSGGFSHGTRLVRNQKAVLRMPERREIVVLAVQSEVEAGVFHRRLRYGEAFDATPTFSVSTNWSSYIDTLTLTSSDSSHTDFSTQSKFADVGYPTAPRDLFAAGCVWDGSANTAWVWGNNTGADLYKLTGLAAGNTVTTERMASTARPLTNSFNGTFGRCMLVTRGSIKCLVRVSATTNYAEIVRVQ